MECTSKARVSGTDTHDGKVVQCDAGDHAPGYHAGPVPGTEPGAEQGWRVAPLRYAWTDANALPSECGTEVGSHHANPHTCGLDERPEDVPDTTAARWLAGRRDGRAGARDERNAQAARAAEVAAEQVDPDEVQPCGHTERQHDEGAGLGGGMEGLLRAIGVLPPAAPAPEPEGPDLDKLLRSLSDMQNVHAAILGAAAAHRQACEAAGFSPTAAEGLAFTFYMQVLGK